MPGQQFRGCLVCIFSAFFCSMTLSPVKITLYLFIMPLILLVNQNIVSGTAENPALRPVNPNRSPVHWAFSQICNVHSALWICKKLINFKSEGVMIKIKYFSCYAFNYNVKCFAIALDMFSHRGEVNWEATPLQLWPSCGLGVVV